MSTRSALERCVGDAGEFVQHAFGVEPRLHEPDERERAAATGGEAPFGDLLDLDDVDAALTTGGLRRPAVRLVHDGEPVDPSTWTRRARTGSTTVDDVVDADRVLDHHARGATVVLQSLHRWWQPVGSFCRELEGELTHAVQANAYLTPAGAAGLAPHHDSHDVFVLQVHGAKRWVVREPAVEAPLRRHRSDAGAAGRRPLLFEAELRPGSVLYLPRGVVHSARAQEGTSLHLTIGVLATTGADVVARIARLAGDVPALRRSLPAGWARDPAAAEAAVKEVVTGLGDLVAGLDAGELTEQLTAGFVSARAPSRRGRLLDLEAANGLDDDSEVTCRDGHRPRVDVGEGRLRLHVGDRTIDMPAAVAPAVDRLLRGGPVRVAELGDVLDASGRLVLVRRLIREGVLAPVRLGAPEPDAARSAEGDG